MQRNKNKTGAAAPVIFMRGCEGIVSMQEEEKRILKIPLSPPKNLTNPPLRTIIRK